MSAQAASALPQVSSARSSSTAKPHSTFVLPTDFSEQAAKALLWAAKYLIHHDDKVVLLHAVEEGSDPSALNASSLPQKEADALYQGAERQLGDWVRELKRRLNGKHAVIETKVVFGPAGTASVQAVEAIRPSMVVLSAHGQTDSHSLVMGPVATYVATYTRCCPVILVRDSATENDDIEENPKKSPNPPSHAELPNH